MTQPALTRARQKLEEELGAALLRRERARTYLTDFGRLMRPRLALLLAGSQDAASTAASFLRLERAPLSIGIMCTIGPMRLATFLEALRARHPGLEISLLDGTLHTLKGRLAAGELDIAILAQPDPFPRRCTRRRSTGSISPSASPRGIGSRRSRSRRCARCTAREGRHHSPPVRAFIAAARTYPWVDVPAA